MDKFGIFKLLTSFYDYFSKNKQNLSFFNDKEKSAKDNDVINENPLTKESIKTDFNLQKNKSVPLKNKMLFVMKNHDNTVKKILENNKK